MPRIKRQISYTKVYHIMLRRINKQNIFICDNDYLKFLKIIKKSKSKYKYEIYSYCLMSNHTHLIIYDQMSNLSKIMQSIEISYSDYFNKKYERIGHLFQNRFLSKQIEDKEYLKTACRYIHKNPQKAGISKTEDYKWSSYKEYIGKNQIINPKMLLSLFSTNESQGIDEFIKFHNVESSTEISDLIEYEMKEKITDDELSRYICELVNIPNVYKILEYNTEKRNKILAKIKENKKITSVQISRVLGINRKIIERAK